MPRGASPGERRGGRKAGTPNNASLARQKAVAASGVTPLDVMLENMRYAHSGAHALVEKLAEVKVLDGDSIVQYREMMRLRQVSQDCAKEAAPYVHPKLTAVEHTTPPGRPMQNETTHKLDAKSAELIANLVK